VNNLRWLDERLQEQKLTPDQRDLIVQALEESSKQTFQQIRRLLKLGSGAVFNIEDAKRSELKGNATSATLSKAQYFGADWCSFSPALQDEIVVQLLTEENETVLLSWLQAQTGASEIKTKAIVDARMVDGYGSLSRKAINQILPELQADVCTYDVAVLAAGFDHHSYMGALATGEVLPELPYYGQALQRHVGFGTGVDTDSDEKRYGRIANPTVHIGLNQVRVVVNELINRYGHPSQVVLELARDLKQSWEQKRETERQQALNQKRNERCRREIAELLGIAEEHVRRSLIRKMMLWEELSFDPAERRCPYTGVQISLRMLLGDEVEIEHILPFGRTLDDSLNNKTVSLRAANRLKANSTPWEAFGKVHVAGFDYDAILARAQRMPLRKRYRFAPDGYERWLKNDKDFLARALNDTRYLSRMAKEYLTLVCPQATWVIPGQLTALLRGRFGLNNADILGWNGQKNREDHRHHAIDACVIGITDRSMLNRLSEANASAREMMLGRLVESMPLPWPTYREHVKRAVNNIWVSHKPDHSYEKSMHNDTAYGFLDDGRVSVHKQVDGVRTKVIERLNVIPVSSAKAGHRHGYLADGSARPYKGYKGDSNYCIEIVRDPDSGRWQGEVVSTFQAYQVIRQYGPAKGWERLRNKRQGLSGKPLAMRLMINDMIRLEDQELVRTMRVAKVSGNGQIFLADTHEANVDARNRNKDDLFAYVSKMAGSLQKAKARRITVSPAGRLRDPGFLLE
jgi:CRISPR-associated endonuclease Csn1